MADATDSEQFRNRKNTKEQAGKGGEASPENFGKDQGTDPNETGRKGARAQPHEAKVEGGQQSHQNEDS